LDKKAADPATFELVLVPMLPLLDCWDIFAAAALLAFDDDGKKKYNLES